MVWRRIQKRQSWSYFSPSCNTPPLAASRLFCCLLNTSKAVPWLTVFHEQLLFGTCIIVNNVCWKHYSFSVERTECEDLVLPTQREDSVQVLGLFTRFILRRYWRFQWGLVKWNHWQLKDRGDQWCTVSPVLFTKKVWCYFQPTLTLFVSVKLDSSQKEGLLLASSCVCNVHHHKPLVCLLLCHIHTTCVCADTLPRRCCQPIADSVHNMSNTV